MNQWIKLMKREHEYTLALNWTGDREQSDIRNDRLYEIQIDGKPKLLGSADKPFFGDPAMYNPEDLLMSALSACHMMSFLYLCRKNKIEIESYSDCPVGILKLNLDGSGQFEKVTLKPKVKVRNLSEASTADELHQLAGKLCFIANSCNFEIVYQPKTH